MLWTNKKSIIKGYFNSHIKRRPFKTKWPIYYKQLTKLFADKMACGNYTNIIKKAFNKNSVWNQSNINLNSFNYNNKNSEGKHKNNKNPNTPHSTV